MAVGIAFIHIENAKKAGLRLDDLISMPYDSISPYILWNNKKLGPTDYYVFVMPADRRKWEETRNGSLFRRLEKDPNYTSIEARWGN